MTTDLRARLGTAAMGGAPLVLAAAALIHPAESTDADRQLRIVAAGLNRWYLAHLLYLVGFALFVPAVLTLGARLRDGAPRAELWGTGLAVLGLFASAGIVAVEGLGAWQLAQATDRAAAADVLHRLTTSAGVVIPFGVVGLAMPIGLVVLAVALGRAAAVAGWTAWVLGAGAVLVAVALPTGVTPALVAGLAGVAIAFGAVALSDTRGRRTGDVRAVTPASSVPLVTS